MQVGDLVNFVWIGEANPFFFGCLIIDTTKSQRPYGLPGETEYTLLLSNGEHYYRASKEQLVLVNGANGEVE